ncbi:MAG: helix-turn-helix domain-containing protein [Phycisphaerales bacterium]
MRDYQTSAATHDNEDQTTGCLTPPEASRYLSVSVKELERLRRVGGGPRYAKLGRKLVRYPVAELDAWVSEHVVSNTAEAAAKGVGR